MLLSFLHLVCFICLQDIKPAVSSLQDIKPAMSSLQHTNGTFIFGSSNPLTFKTFYVKCCIGVIFRCGLCLLGV